MRKQFCVWALFYTCDLIWQCSPCSKRPVNHSLQQDRGGGYLQFLPMMEVLIEREGPTAESGLIELLRELAFQDANKEYTKPRMATAITTHCVPFFSNKVLVSYLYFIQISSRGIKMGQNAIKM